MANDPCHYRGTPVTDSSYFFGRKEETRSVLLDVVERKLSISVVGPSGIGKSSLLFHLREHDVRAAEGVGRDDIFVYINWRELSGHRDLNRPDAYRFLLKKIAEETEGEYCNGLDFQAPVTYSDFEGCLSKITATRRQVVFLFDHFDVMAGNRQLDRGFYDSLHYLAEARKAAYVTASGRELYDLPFYDTEILTSPFFEIFRSEWLGLMRSEEAEELINGLGAMIADDFFDERDRDFLEDIAGPHPYCLQEACCQLIEEKTRKAGSTAPDYDSVKHRFAREMRGHFQYTWARLSEEEQAAIKSMSERRLERGETQSPGSVRSQIRRFLGYSPPQKGMESSLDTSMRQRLEDECVVSQGEVFSAAFAEFVQQKAVEEKPVAKKTGLEESDALEEIKRLIERRTLAFAEPLSKFDGFVAWEFVDIHGNAVSPSEEEGQEIYMLSQGQDYRLRVTIQSQDIEPSGSGFSPLHLDGEEVGTVNFTVVVDCDTLMFEPNELDFTVGTEQDAVTETARFTVGTQQDALTETTDLKDNEKSEHVLFLVLREQTKHRETIRLDLSF